MHLLLSDLLMVHASMLVQGVIYEFLSA